MLLAAAAALVPMALAWWWNGRHAIIVNANGITERGWLFTTRIGWGEIAYCDEELDADPLAFEVSELEELLLKPPAQLVQPLCWLYRCARYGRRSPRFYRGVLTLRGGDHEKVHQLEASDGWADVEALFERVKTESRAWRARLVGTPTSRGARS